MRVHPPSVGHRKNCDGSIRNLAAVSVIVLAGLTASTSLASTVVLDNTAGLTQAWYGGNSYWDSDNVWAKAFSTGSTATTIGTISMALRDDAAGSGTGSVAVTFELYAADPNSTRLPTGPILGTYTQTLLVTSSYAYYTMNVNNEISLLADTSYVLVFKNDRQHQADNSVHWAAHATWWQDTQNMTASGGFGYNGSSRSTNGGTVYNVTIGSQLWQMSVNAGATAVPGIGGLAAIAGVGLAGRRRRR